MLSVFVFFIAARDSHIFITGPALPRFEGIMSSK